MSGQFVHDASMVGSGVTITSGLMLWFGENATAIGAITTVVVGLLTVIFQLLNYKLNQKRLEFDRRKAPNRESEK